MNTLELIRTLVAAHEAATALLKKANSTGRQAGKTTAHVTIADAQYEAIGYLRDLLPLLEVAAKIELNDGKMPEFQWFSLIGNYETEVQKLLAEVAE